MRRWTRTGVLGLQVPDRRFDRLAALEPAPLLAGHRSEPSATQDLDAGVVDIDPAITEIDNDLLRSSAGVLEQDVRLLELRREDASICLTVKTALTGPSHLIEAAAEKIVGGQRGKPRSDRFGKLSGSAHDYSSLWKFELPATCREIKHWRRVPTFRRANDVVIETPSHIRQHRRGGNCPA